MSPRKRFALEFGLSMALYIITVVVTSIFLGDLQPGVGKTLLAVLPVIPLVAVAIAVLRQLRQLDEMGRMIQLEALGIAFLGTALITFSYGFLETAGFPRLSMFMVWSLMGPLWAIGAFIGTRRYR